MSGTAYTGYVDGTPTNGVNPWIDSLVWGGAWADSPGLASTGGPVTISFAAVYGTDPYNVLSGPAMSWSPAGLAALGNALASWESVANLDFVQAASGNSDVWFWQGSAAAAEGALGWSEIPGYAYGEPLYTVFNGQHSSWSNAGLAIGGYGYITLVHEIGHLLGLAHPHDGGSAADLTVFPGVTGPFDSFGTYSLNQGIFTVMSYNDGWPTLYPSHTNQTFGWQSGPMALDIAAIQAIYGANMGYATGNNSYILPSVNTAGTYWSCIWDAGGLDTISNAGSALACAINLNAAPLVGPNAGGYVSYAAGIIGGFTIANGVIIENAIGGNGNDTLSGNAWNNYLNGGLGADSMIGGMGNDTYFIDNLADKVVELVGAGTDTIQTSLSVFSLVNLPNVENLTYTGSDNFSGTGNSLNNVITGSNFNDSLYGGAGNDSLYGGSGNDLLVGGEAADTMVGGSGNDIYVVDSVGDNVTESAGQGTDTIQTNLSTFSLATLGNVENLTYTGSGTFNGTGNALNNVIIGGSFNDSLSGGAGKDQLFGGGGADYLVGGTGNDLMNGGIGADAMVGGAGNDVYVVDSAGDVVTELAGQGTDTIQTNLSTFSLATLGNVENLTYTGSGNFSGTGNSANNVIWGNVGNDSLYGGAGNDYLYGSSGNDQLFGGSGTDFLYGGIGNDALYGGENADRFVFDGQGFVFDGQGNDIVTDFSQAQHDQIVLLGVTFSDLLASMEQVGTNTVIDFGGGSSLTLSGVNMLNLTINDFFLL